MISKETSSDMIKEPFTIMGESAKKKNILAVQYIRCKIFASAQKTYGTFGS